MIRDEVTITMADNNQLSCILKVWEVDLSTTPPTKTPIDFGSFEEVMIYFKKDATIQDATPGQGATWETHPVVAGTMHGYLEFISDGLGGFVLGQLKLGLPWDEFAALGVTPGVYRYRLDGIRDGGSSHETLMAGPFVIKDF